MATINKVRRPWMAQKKYAKKTFDPFYQSKPWRKLRNAFMADPVNGLCVECAKRGVDTIATECDHILPIKKGGEALDPANLQPLCRSCHASKSAREK